MKLLSVMVCTWLAEYRAVCLKITRKIKRTLQKSLVEHSVAERKQWSKFGQEKGASSWSMFPWKIRANTDGRQQSWS